MRLFAHKKPKPIHIFMLLSLPCARGKYQKSKVALSFCHVVHSFSLDLTSRTLHSLHFVYVDLLVACMCVRETFCVNISHNTLMFDDLNEFGYEFENNHAIIYQNDCSRLLFIYPYLNRSEQSAAAPAAAAGEGEGEKDKAIEPRIQMNGITTFL